MKHWGTATTSFNWVSELTTQFIPFCFIYMFCYASFNIIRIVCTESPLTATSGQVRVKYYVSIFHILVG